MAQQALFPGKVLLLMMVVVIGCKNNPSQTTKVLLNKNEQQIAIVNGLTVVNNIAFSGRLFGMYPGTKDTAEITSYTNGKEDGEWKQFYPQHKLKEIRWFSNGSKTGRYIAWWPNGQIQLQFFFVNDEYQGTCREWGEDGRLTKVMTYNKGHEEGQQQEWYANGKIKANYIIKDGRRFGLLGTKNCMNVSDSIFKN